LPCSRLWFKKYSLFFFDEYKIIDLNSILEQYNSLFNKNIRQEEYLFIFDEIQKLENWP